MEQTLCREFFLSPADPQQRRYEALRAVFVDGRPMPEVAREFGFAHGTLRNLACRFRAWRGGEGPPPFSVRRHAGVRPTVAPRRSRSPNRPPSPTAVCCR
jgi:hypothetical protein